MHAYCCVNACPCPAPSGLLTIRSEMGGARKPELHYSSGVGSWIGNPPGYGKENVIAGGQPANGGVAARRVAPALERHDDGADLRGCQEWGTYSFPVGYAEDEEGLVTFTRFGWWKTFRVSGRCHCACAGARCGRAHSLLYGTQSPRRQVLRREGRPRQPDGLGGSGQRGRRVVLQERICVGREPHPRSNTVHYKAVGASGCSTVAVKRPWSLGRDLSVLSSISHR